MNGSVRLRWSLIGRFASRASSAARRESLIQTKALALLTRPARKHRRIESVVETSSPRSSALTINRPIEPSLTGFAEVRSEAHKTDSAWSREGRRVMVGFADALAAIESVWSLLGAGFSVSAFTRAGHAPVLRRLDSVELHQIAAPERNVEDSLRDLRAAMHASDSGALMPLDDAAVWLCQRACEGTPWVLVGPRGTQAEVALNKQLQCDVATAAGFPVPDTQFLKAPARPGRDCTVSTGCPASGGGGGKGGAPGDRRPCATCADAGELNRAEEAFDPGCFLMVQPRLQGIGEGVFGLATPAGVLAWSAHRRIRMMNPAGSGSSACVSIPLDDQVRDQAESMLTRLEMVGAIHARVASRQRWHAMVRRVERTCMGQHGARARGRARVPGLGGRASARGAARQPSLQYRRRVGTRPPPGARDRASACRDARAPLEPRSLGLRASGPCATSFLASRRPRRTTGGREGLRCFWRTQSRRSRRNSAQSARPRPHDSRCGSRPLRLVLRRQLDPALRWHRSSAIAAMTSC